MVSSSSGRSVSPAAYDSMEHLYHLCGPGHRMMLDYDVGHIRASKAGPDLPPGAPMTDT
jgi:hypothetical protein